MLVDTLMLSTVLWGYEEREHKMKLRNKKTGELGDLQTSQKHIAVVVGNGTSEVSISMYNSLDELNEEWEDHKEKELLIMYKEIRKIIRLWATINDITELTYNYNENSFEDIFRNTITFNPALGLKDGNTYTIEELCGN